MELRHLRYFAAVAEAENISLAAERLHVSQPPLSRQIRQLEEELGVELLERTGKSVRLTQAGRAFAKEVSHILFQVDKAIGVARSAGGVEPLELRIGYAPSLTVKILPPALEIFQQRYPKIRVHLLDLDSSETIRRLRSHSIDIGLIIDPGKGALRGLVFKELRCDPVSVVLPISHPLARKTSVPAEQLSSERFLGLTSAAYPEYRRWFANVFKHTGRRAPPIAEEHDSISGLIAAVKAGRGITIGGEGIRDMVGKRLRVRHLAPPAPPVRVGAVFPLDHPSPLVARFLECMASSEPDPSV